MRERLLDIQRTWQLLWVSLKFGLGPLIRSALHLPFSGPTVGVRVRLALEEMGLTYLKLGQFLAMRVDLLPAEVCRELSKLFEQITPIHAEAVRKTIESELGGTLEDHFSEFDLEPIAAASVAQVHKARTQANHEVAVKVQRPGIQPIFAADMRNLRRFAFIIDLLGITGTLPIQEIVNEFAKWTGRELDFTIEGRTADRLRKSTLPFEKVPDIYWELTTSKLLTMGFIEATSLNEISILYEEGGIARIKLLLPWIDISLILHRLAFASLHQLFVVGFFHGDPHPGNILVLPDNSVAFVDFGIFGELTDIQLMSLTGTIENLAIGDIEESFRYYYQQMIPTESSDLRSFQQGTKSILRNWYHAINNPFLPVQERLLGKYSGDLFEVVRKNSFGMTVDTLLFWRALNALDSSAQRFPEHFDLLSELRNFFNEYRPGLAQRVFSTLIDSRFIALSKQLVIDLSKVERPLSCDMNEIHLRSHINNFESPELDRQLDKNIRWIVGGIIVVALVVLTASVPLASIIVWFLLFLLLLSLDRSG